MRKIFEFFQLCIRELCFSIEMTFSSKISLLIALSRLGWWLSVSSHPSLRNRTNLGNLGNLAILKMGVLTSLSNSAAYLLPLILEI